MSNNVAPAVDATLQAAATGNGPGTPMSVGGLSGVLLQVSGSASCTVTPQVALPGQAYVAVPCVNIVTGAIVPAATGIAANGLYFVPLSGADQLEAVVSGLTTGAVTVTGKGIEGPPPWQMSALQASGSIVGSVNQGNPPWTQNLTAVGGTAVAAGQAAMAASVPVAIASNQSNVPENVVQWGGVAVVTGGINGAPGVGGLAANGSALAGNPVLMAGSDGTNARDVATDAAGVVKTGHVPLGAALEVGSANAAAANNQTLAAAAGKTTYISGFDVSGLGATAGSTIAVTVTGLSNTLTFYYTVPAGVTAAAPNLSIRFDPPLPASAPNTAIVVNVPSFGAGNTTAAASAYGFQV